MLNKGIGRRNLTGILLAAMVMGMIAVPMIGTVEAKMKSQMNEPPRPVFPHVTLQGRVSKIERISLMAINTPAEWDRAVRTCFDNRKHRAKLTYYDKAGKERDDRGGDSYLFDFDTVKPPADLKKHTALFIFTGVKMPSGVPWVNIKAIDNYGAVRIVYEVTKPQIHTRSVKEPSPFAIVFIPKTEGPVVFAKSDKQKGDKQIAWVGPGRGGNVINGLQLKLEVKPTAWSVGAVAVQPEFVCTVRNVSDKPLRIPKWGLMDFSHALEITDASGNVMTLGGGRNKTLAMPKDAFPVIKPGKKKEFTLLGTFNDKKMLIVPELCGGFWTWTLPDGMYSVRATMNVRRSDGYLERYEKVHGKIWTGSVRSAPIRVATGRSVAVKPGEPVNGLKLMLSADKKTLKMTRCNLRRALADTPRYATEPTKLTLTFTNVSDEPIKLDTYDLVWRSLKLNVTGPDEKSVRVTLAGILRKMAAPAAKDYPTIAPGESWTYPHRSRFPGHFGPKNYSLLKPGEYRISVTYALPERMTVTKGTWLGTVTSNELVLKAALVK